MAFIVPDVVTKSDSRCALSRADFGRQRDIFILAKRKDKVCRRLWEEFAREDPGMARLVIADVESEKAKDQAAKRHLDVVLAKSEKTAKPLSKKAKKEIKRTPVPSRSYSVDAFLASLLNSENPADRENARNVLASRGVHV